MQLKNLRGAKSIFAVAAALLVWAALDFLVRPIPNTDVTANSQYAEVLGKRFRTQHDLTAVGYTMDRNYRKQIDYIALVTPPGFSGPEVIAKSELPKGSVLKVTGVLKANSWLVHRIQYVVTRIDGPPPLMGRMVLDVDHNSNRNFGLSESDYVLVRDDA